MLRLSSTTRVRAAVSAGLAGLATLLLAAPLAAHGPAPGASAPAAPHAYGIQGDASNTGFGITYFFTEAGDHDGGWQFFNSNADSTVLGASCSTGTDCWGLKGKGTSRGVYGQATGSTGKGVVGEGMSYGVYGQTTSTNGIGVYGKSTGGHGVFGSSTNGFGVTGSSTNNFGVRAVSSSNYGIYASSDTSSAVRALSTSQYALYATTTSGTGAYISTSTGAAAVRAVNATKTAGYYALIADGNVQINGSYVATGTKSARVTTTTGDRLMYAQEATTNIFSDAGAATLKDGRAVITLDPLYAQTVSLGAGYQVYLTPRAAATYGLAVVAQTAAGFEVRELQGGRGNFGFYWRVDAPRKGYEKDRMAPAPPVPAAPADQPVGDTLDLTK